MVTTTSDTRFDIPLYTVAEAARALDVNPTTLATWAKGYTRHPPGRRAVVGAPILTAFSDHAPGSPSIPFIGLAEGMVLAAVRAAGVPLQRVRPALEAVAQQLGLEHALASRRLMTDGAELLVDFAESVSDDDSRPLRELVVIRSDQRVFAEVIQRYLQLIDYGADGYAQLVRLPAYSAADVVADPSRAFGQPIFARGRSRLTDVLSRFWAGEDLRAVSDEFGVPLSELEDVVRVASRRAA